jgi:hypothetical protein
LCPQVVRALYLTPTDDGWAFGDAAPSRALASQLRIQWLIVQVAGASSPAPQDDVLLLSNKESTLEACPRIRAGDMVYIYGSPFPQLQAEALQNSVRCGHVSNVVLGAHHTAPADVDPPSSTPSSCLLLLDFKNLPGASPFSIQLTFLLVCMREVLQQDQCGTVSNNCMLWQLVQACFSGCTWVTPKLREILFHSSAVTVVPNARRHGRQCSSGQNRNASSSAATMLVPYKVGRLPVVCCAHGIPACFHSALTCIPTDGSRAIESIEQCPQPIVPQCPRVQDALC